jgi:histidine kinase
MKWYRQLRWKLVVSHLVVGIVTVVVLLGTAQFLTNVGFLSDMLPGGEQAGIGTAESDQVSTAAAAINDQRELFRNVLRDALLVSAFAALEAALIVSLSVATRIVEPLQAITAVSRRLAQGFYQERTEIGSDDELAELSRSVNQLAEALEQTEQRRMALLADVAHEIRTPLATIGGYMEGLIDGIIKSDQQTFELVLHESARLRRLTEDLELLSRAEAGRIAITPRQMSLSGTLQKMMQRFEPQFAAQHIELVLGTTDTLPSVYADPDRVDQILINLLTNALRYTPSGGKVTLCARPLREDDTMMVISVEDTGIGIAPEHLPHLFERFYRVDKSRARASGGSGVGLTIARHLVYAQGGDIWAVSSGTGRGSKFHFTLPRTSMSLPGTYMPDSSSS